MIYVLLFCYFNYFNIKPSKLASFQFYSFLPREDRGDREGTPYSIGNSSRVIFRIGIKLPRALRGCFVEVSHD